MPEATAAIDELQAVTTTLRLRDIRACLAPKLWDEQEQRMTGYPIARIPDVRCGAHKLQHFLHSYSLMPCRNVGYRVPLPR